MDEITFEVVTISEVNISSIINKLCLDVRRGSPEEWHILRMISALRLLARGINIQKTLLVDQWPNFECVALFRELDDVFDETEMFCKNEPASIEKMVKLVLNWIGSQKKPMQRLVTIPDYVWPKLKALTPNEHECTILSTCVCLLRRNPLTLDIELPSNIASRSLTPDDVASVTKTWRYGKARNTPLWMREIFKEENLSIGLFVESDLIGHMFTDRTGTMCALYIDPKYRRKGLGSYMVQQLSNMRLAQKCAPLVEVVEENQLGKPFFEQMGFDQLSRSTYFLFTRKEPEIQGQNVRHA